MKSHGLVSIVWIAALLFCAVLWIAPAVKHVDAQLQVTQQDLSELREDLVLTQSRLRCAEARFLGLTLAKPYPDLQAVSVRVDVGDGCGTGVLVTRQLGGVTHTFVWTAGHVVQGLRRIDGTFEKTTIYQERRKQGKYLEMVKTQAKVIAYSDPDRGDDLALLEILKDNFCNVSATFILDNDALPVGTELIHVGCTLGLYNSTSLGIISQTDRDILTTGRGSTDSLRRLPRLIRWRRIPGGEREVHWAPGARCGTWAELHSANSANAGLGKADESGVGHECRLQDADACCAQ